MELEFPDIICVGTVSHVTLPLRSQSTTAISVNIHVDFVTIDGVASSADDRSFLVTPRNCLLNTAASYNIQVFTFHLFIHKS